MVFSFLWWNNLTSGLTKIFKMPNSLVFQNTLYSKIKPMTKRVNGWCLSWGVYGIVFNFDDFRGWSRQRVSTRWGRGIRPVLFFCVSIWFRTICLSRLLHVTDMHGKIKSMDRVRIDQVPTAASSLNDHVTLLLSILTILPPLSDVFLNNHFCQLKRHLTSHSRRANTFLLAGSVQLK